MLAKLETFYLSILRVVVLVAATLALVVVAIALAASAPTLVSLLDHKPPAAEIPGGSLGDWVAEKNATAQTSPDVVNPATEAGPTGVPLNISQAAAIISAYIRDRSHANIDVGMLTQALVKQQATVPAADRNAYGDSLLALAAQLKASTGRPLSLENVGALIEWHLQKFKDHVEAVAAEKALQAQRGQLALIVAAGGFGVFLMIVFCFLVVKIERNLRLVHTVAEPARPGAAHG